MQVVDGPSRIVSLDCVQSQWAQLNEGLRKCAWVQVREFVVRKPGHTLPWIACWKDKSRNTSARQSQQQDTWHRDLHGWISHKGPVWLEVHSHAGWRDYIQRQLYLLSQHLLSDHGDGGSHTYSTVAGCPEWHISPMQSFSQTRWTCYKKWSLGRVVLNGTQSWSTFPAIP